MTTRTPGPTAGALSKVHQTSRHKQVSADGSAVPWLTALHAASKPQHRGKKTHQDKAGKAAAPTGHADTTRHARADGKSAGQDKVAGKRVASAQLQAKQPAETPSPASQPQQPAARSGQKQAAGDSVAAGQVRGNQRAGGQETASRREFVSAVDQAKGKRAAAQTVQTNTLNKLPESDSRGVQAQHSAQKAAPQQHKSVQTQNKVSVQTQHAQAAGKSGATSQPPLAAKPAQGNIATAQPAANVQAQAGATTDVGQSQVNVRINSGGHVAQPKQVDMNANGPGNVVNQGASGAVGANGHAASVGGTSAASAGGGVGASGQAPLNQGSLQAMNAQIHALHQAGGGQANIQLDPPSLGSVQIQLNMNSHHQAQVSFTAAQPATAQALQASLPQLSAAMHQNGIQLSHSEVHATNTDSSLSGQPGSGFQGQQNPQGQPGGQGSTRESLNARATHAVTRPDVTSGARGNDGVRAYA